MVFTSLQLFNNIKTVLTASELQHKNWDYRHNINTNCAYKEYANTLKDHKREKILKIASLQNTKYIAQKTPDKLKQMQNMRIFSNSEKYITKLREKQNKITTQIYSMNTNRILKDFPD